MTTFTDALKQLSDQDLITAVRRLAACEAKATADLIASLSELDVRRLYVAEGYSSLFTYCTGCLHLSEHAAYRRIEAARVVRRFPLILERLAEGALTLTAVGLLAAHLTEENQRAVLDEARHQRKSAVEQLAARLQARPDAPRTSIRKLPGPRPSPVPAVAADERAERATTSLALLAAEAAAAPADPAGPAAAPLARRPALIRPLTPERYQLQLTVSAETHAKLRRAQDLLRHAIPNGDPVTIVDRALTLLLQHLERQTFGAKHGRRRAGDAAGPARSGRRPNSSSRAPSVSQAGSEPPSRKPPAPRSRHIPAEVRRAVWARDEGRCTFVGAGGRRCDERGFLEFHHRLPHAAGGAATVDNIALVCRRHNAFEADKFFGPTLGDDRSTCAQPGGRSSGGPCNSFRNELSAYMMRRW
jgi:hypothetical protein